MRKILERRLQSLKWRFRPALAGKAQATHSLDEAAQFFGLDLEDTGQRDLLLFVLAEAVFGKDKPPKGPQRT